jgi:hypothetical protein
MKSNRDISLLCVYKMFTSSNRNSHIDSFLDRAVNVATFTQQLASALEHKNSN